MTVDAQEWIDCPECEGSGARRFIRCCGDALPNDECCGNGIDDAEPCDFCRGFGGVPPERPSP